jgi:hypothetical protein
MSAYVVAKLELPAWKKDLSQQHTRNLITRSRML